jgi:hypothetical protein
MLSVRCPERPVTSIFASALEAKTGMSRSNVSLSACPRYFQIAQDSGLGMICRLAPPGRIFLPLSRANPTHKILIRTDVITNRMNRPAHQFENDITSTLPTSRENLMLPQEYLMGWTVAEVQCLIYPGDANVFAGYAKHRNVRDDFCRARRSRSAAA